MFRSLRNWSQADLAEHANISINFLGDIERGKKWPHPDTLSKLAKALEISVFELFLEENKPQNFGAEALLSRFAKDVSLSVNKSLTLSINQSIDYVCKQYKMK